MTKKFRKGEKVYWMWLGRPVHGAVEEIYLESVSKTIKGKKITRHGSEEKPAYLVKSEAGNLVLKLQSELKTKKTPAPSSIRPQIFSSKS